MSVADFVEHVAAPDVEARESHPHGQRREKISTALRFAQCGFSFAVYVNSLQDADTCHCSDCTPCFQDTDPCVYHMAGTSTVSLANDHTCSLNAG